MNGPAVIDVPRRDAPAVQACGRELVLGLRQGELLERVAAAGRRLEHRRSGRERRRQRLGVGVVAVEVGDEPGDGAAGARRDDLRQRRPRRPLAERREHRARVPERIHHHRRVVRLQLRPGPAQPCQSHRPSSVSLAGPEVIQHDRSFGIMALMPRRSAADVADSRASAVEAAVDLASVEGLEGITIGRLAGELAMSKSGLIGRFGDKEAMQRAVLAAAVERFTDAVWRPASAVRAGAPAPRGDRRRVDRPPARRRVPRRLLRDHRVRRVRRTAGPAARRRGGGRPPLARRARGRGAPRARGRRPPRRTATPPTSPSSSTASPRAAASPAG